MFLKSKRFPEAGKDYIPGPGEYDVSNDDLSRHKRYGFLTQTNRFFENQNHDESSEFYISTNHEGTTTASSTASISSDTRASSTSSNRTTDDIMTTSCKLNTKRSPSSPTTETSYNQFEKYRHIMQKEMEALQARTKKMESTIHSLEFEKNDTKVTLLSKDLELAELRSKNANLQKIMNRQEKSSKAAQLQKKVEQLEEQLTLLQNRHKKELQDENQIIEQYQADLNRSNSIIMNLEQVQQEQIIAYEALEAQVASMTVQLSESKNNASQFEINMNQLQQDLKCMESTNDTLMQDLDAQLDETRSLKTLNRELMTRLQTRQENISQLESLIILKDEEIDALLNTIDERDRTVEEKSTLVVTLQTQFKTYRHRMDHTVVPHLRAQRFAAQNHHFTELNQLLTELHEAKKFINHHAQYLDGLKSDVYWLTVQNQQLNDIVSNMSKERTEQYNLNTKLMFGTKASNKKNISSNHNKKHQQHKKKNKQTAAATVSMMVEDDVSDTVSFLSKSTVSNHDEGHKQQRQQCDTPSPLDSNVIVQNDSGFGILLEEAK